MLVHWSGPDCRPKTNAHRRRLQVKFERATEVRLDQSGRSHAGEIKKRDQTSPGCKVVAQVAAVALSVLYTPQPLEVPNRRFTVEIHELR